MKKKLFVSCSLALAALLCLSACSTDTDTNSPDVTVTPEPTETVSENPSGIQGVDGVIRGDSIELTVASVELKDEIHTEAGLDYTAEEGTQFLLVFFNATNFSEETQNMFTGLFNGYIDGLKVQPELVLGKINGRMQLDGALSPGMTNLGYVVWPVPDGWNELQFSYFDGLSETGMMIIKSTDVGYTAE